MRTKRNDAVAALLSAGTLLSVAPVATLAQDVPVGHLADFSGPTADVGRPYGQGVADAIAYINGHGGVGGKKIAAETIDYSYKAPQAISAYKGWSGRVVAIQGWGTADTEALIGFVTNDKIPYYSASYAATLTDPVGGSKAGKGAPYNFFYGPSYSDYARGMVQWAADDWKKKGGKGKPKYVHMGANHPYPNSPKAAAEEYAKELGFEVLTPIEYSLKPGDFTAQCLTLKQSEAHYAYLGNTSGSNVAVLKACQTVGVKAQFLGNVWGMDENAMKAAGSAANNVVYPVRTSVIWTDAKAPKMAMMREVSKMSDPSGTEYRASHYLAAVCATLYMKEAMEWAAAHGGITGENIRKGMYVRQNWVPKGTEGVCMPSTWMAEDHRSVLKFDLYRTEVKGSTDGSIGDLIAKGAIQMKRVATIDLPRKKEWLGW
jgi:branched-chain amino acid transport system substrate-binding protein